MTGKSVHRSDRAATNRIGADERKNYNPINGVSAVNASRGPPTCRNVY